MLVALRVAGCHRTCTTYFLSLARFGVSGFLKFFASSLLRSPTLATSVVTSVVRCAVSMESLKINKLEYEEK